MTHDRSSGPILPDAPATPTLDRRELLRRLGGAAFAVTFAAPLAGLARAQGMMHQHGADQEGTHAPGGMMGSGPGGAAGATPPPAGARTAGHPHAHAIPWDGGTCAFCGMTLATPAMGALPAGFRERTYAQWAFGAEARHFESIGCALGWAYAHGVLDGEGAALYAAAYDATARPEAADLLAGRAAAYLWAEGLPASMRAHLGAFRDHGAAVAFVAAADAAGPALGRRRFVDLALLEDLAPLPIANLIPLLARQAGLGG